MAIADTAASVLFKLAKHTGKKLNKAGPAPVIPDAEPVTMKNDEGYYNCGFGCEVIMPDDVTSKKYYLAGFRMDNRVTGVINNLTARCMWLDTGDGKGVAMCSVDCIGLTGWDVNEIRKSLSDFSKRTGCTAINISCTHTHGSIDTVGYWGRLFPLQTGRDKEYMKIVYAGIKKAVETAYETRTRGKLYFGSVHVPEAIKDGRFPYVCNDLLTRFRFVPDDGGAETWFLNYSAHPNTMGGENSQVSADYPHYLRERINKEKTVNVLFSVGAIAAVDIADVAEDRLERTVKGGEILGEKALGIDNDFLLPAEITIVQQPYYAPIDNYVLAFMAITKMCTSIKAASTTSSTGIALRTEMTYMKLGGRKILLLPGEAFTEFVYGGYSDSETSATGKGPEIDPTPLAEIAGDPELIVYGVSNDMTGYMVPPNDAVLHPTQAYLSSTRDKFDRNHYHETNGLGQQIPFVIADTFRKIIERTEK